MDIDLRHYGLKRSYLFKETYIPTTREFQDIHEKLLKIVAPVISELESNQWINGFHYLIHEHIDLRLSSEDWAKYESDIQEILKKYSIFERLKNWAIEDRDAYGGSDGITLCYNNLEYNSRLCLALIELNSQTNDPIILQAIEKLCPHRWVHYLCNQFGYLNHFQIQFEFEDAFAWFRNLMRLNKDNPPGVQFAQKIIGDLKKTIGEFESEFLKP